MKTTPITDPLISNRSNLNGVGHKHLYSTPSGKKWLGKTEYVDCEFDHYVVMNAAGLRVPDIGMRRINTNCTITVAGKDYTHEHTNDDEILIGWLDDCTTLYDLEHEASDISVDVHWTKQQYVEWLRLAIADYVIGMYDRHEENVLIDRAGHIVPIDGAFCFRDLGSDFGENPINDLRWDALSDVFSFTEVMTITADVVSKVRDAVSSFMNPAHADTVRSALNRITTVMAVWYEKETNHPASILCD